MGVYGGLSARGLSDADLEFVIFRQVPEDQIYQHFCRLLALVPRAVLFSTTLQATLDQDFAFKQSLFGAEQSQKHGLDTR